MSEALQFCDFASPRFLIFSDSVPLFVYYSHFPVLLISLLVGFFIFKRGKDYFKNRIVSLILLSFGLWVFFSLITWSSNRSDVIMFVWSLIILIEPVVYFACLYLMEIIYDKKDVALGRKFVWFILYLPLLLITINGHLFSGFDVNTCSPIESSVSNYSYFLEIILILWIIKVYIRKRQCGQDNKKRKKLFILFTGIILFLITFTSGNIVGSTTSDWNIAQIGIFGFHIFVGSIIFLIVKYRSFGSTLHTAQVLIAIFSILVLSLSFLKELLFVQRFVILMTFLLCILIGYFYIRFTERELFLKEKLEKQAVELRTANRKLQELNDMKSEFVSLATHHISTPLTAIKGYVSLLEEGVIEKEQVLNKIRYLTNTLVGIIHDFLDVHKIDLNEVTYYFENVDIKDLILEIVDEYGNVKESESKFISIYDQKQKYVIQADREKLKHAFVNIFENINKYVQQSDCTITFCIKNQMVFIVVSDTAVRNLPLVSSSLLKKFTESGDRNEANIIGQGLGLYLAKQVILAHNGKLKIEFKDNGDGVNFNIILPLRIVN